MGVREINARTTGQASLDDCPAGPYHFVGPDETKDSTGQVNRACDQFHFWSRHPGGANFLYADGSVHFLGYSADDVISAMATRAGGEWYQQP